MAGLTLNARQTIATMGAELSAELVMFEPDDRLVEYVKPQKMHPMLSRYAE